ncbi:MAG TPA: SPOR domain-containing protein [Terriglobales bacterium]|nr:SPOR domain-containing protein [Terriglobales bacterium]
MADPQDTEITLGTGKMLVLFFGLVVLCSVFFALGFKLGRSSSIGPELTSTPSTSTGNTAAKPAAKPADTAPKAMAQDTTPAQAPADNSAKPADTGTAASATPADATATPAPSSNYYVQVAAVSKQEDAEALVDALKKKQYAAFSTALSDKLIRVQIGPFSDIKEAEATRAKLVGDGYNPILKK